MPSEKVLLEFASEDSAPFARNEEATASRLEATRQATPFLDTVAGMGVELDDAVAPVPMMIGPDGGQAPSALESLGFADTRSSARQDMSSRTVVIAAEAPAAAIEAMRGRADVRVWPNSELTLFGAAASTIDCRPFRPAVEIAALRDLLGVSGLWDAGFRGKDIVIGIIDEGVNGDAYPVIGGFALPQAGLQPGEAAIGSHGSMCAADVLVAAPDCGIYDYPFLGVPRSGGALQMFQAVLNQRGIDGTPHLTNNSYGFVGVPPLAEVPEHEVHDPNHPLHRKVREVVAAGVPCFFAAGNCGQNCPSGNCQPSGIGPGVSIHASNSLAEVITVAAVNSRLERIGYSSQGPGMFEAMKPDIAAYSHFFGNFGPGRPAGGGADAFDSGTSAATPVAAGVAALLMSALPGLTPQAIKDALIASADGGGWNRDFGHGVINAAAAFKALRRPALVA